jgi:hypothetical protein
LTVALPLLLAISLRLRGMGSPVVFLVLGMGSPPLLAAVANDQGVLGIAFELVTVIFNAPSALTIRLAANALIGPKFGWLKRLLAITAAARRQEAIPPKSKRTCGE